jgi:hypothetical protein
MATDDLIEMNSIVLGRPDLEVRRLAVDVAELAIRFKQARSWDEGRHEVPDAPDLRRLRCGGERHGEQAQGECHEAPNGVVPHVPFLQSVFCRPSSFH